MKNTYKKAITLITFLSFSDYYAQKTLVNINNIVKEIDAGSSCHPTEWGDNTNSSCICCLVQQAPAVKEKNLSAEKAIKNCQNTPFCSGNYIASLLSSTKSGLTNEEHKLLDLYDTHSVIKLLNTEGMTLTKNGNLTPEAIKVILNRAYQTKKITNPDFQNIECLNPEALAGKVESATTDQIFLIHSLCSPREYILKMLSSGQVEASRLAIGAAIKELKDFTPPTNKPGFPIIIFPLAYISYVYEGKKYIFSLMQKAEGKTLKELVKDYINDPSSQRKKQLLEDFSAAGAAIARFHEQFMAGNTFNGLAHADMHMGNVMVDNKTKTVYLIDNENIANKFTNKSNVIQSDILHLFLFSSSFIYQSPKLSQEEKNNLMASIFESFIGSYIQAFKNKQQKTTYSTIKTNFIQDYRYKPFEAALNKAFQNMNSIF